VDAAITAFRRAIELKPDFEKPTMHWHRVAYQGRNRRGAEGAERYQRAREFARAAQAKYLTLQGVEALKQQKLDDALSFFQKAVRARPEIPTGFTISESLGTKGDTERALAAYQKALELKQTMRKCRPVSACCTGARTDHVRGLERVPASL